MCIVVDNNNNTKLLHFSPFDHVFNIYKLYIL